MQAVGDSGPNPRQQYPSGFSPVSHFLGGSRGNRINSIGQCPGSTTQAGRSWGVFIRAALTTPSTRNRVMQVWHANAQPCT